MEIVNIHCSECRGLIGINKDDLGHPVRCPLCQHIILAALTQGEMSPPGSSEFFASAPSPPQAPTPTAASEGPAMPLDEPEHFLAFAPSSPETASEKDSIFAPEEDTSDSLFGDVQVPRIEIPETDFAEEKTVAETSTHALLADHPVSGEHPPQVEQPSPLVEGAKASTLVQTRGYESRHSMLVPTLLIFLIPYSIFTTLFLGYLLYNQRNANKDPTVRFLEKMLEDNFKNKDNIKRIQFDLPLPENLRTGLKTVKQMGAIEITPLKVVQTPQGDLTLYLRMKNISLDLWFNPLPAEFAKFDRKKTPQVHPYIFLQGDNVRLFGGTVEWLRGEIGKEKLTRDNELKPGEAMTVTLTTSVEDRELVPKILATQGPLLWRIQFRRGLEKLHDEDWSITCVVGIEFSAKEIVSAD